MERKRYTVSWVSVERHYKKQFDTLQEAEAQYNRCLESDRVRVVHLIDNADPLAPVILKTQLSIKR